MTKSDRAIRHMHPVIEELLKITESDPLPAAHTSSHWQLRGAHTTVGRQGNDLILQGFGFGTVRMRHNLFNVTCRAIERRLNGTMVRHSKAYPRVWRTARILARDLTFDLTFDVWKQSVALALLADHWSARKLSPKTFALIGDGYGFLGALIRRNLPESRVYCIDLPKMLVFQARTHQLADGGATMSIVAGKGVEDTQIAFVLPQYVEEVSETIDCGISIASMQEMTDASIAGYFDFLRRRSGPDSRFYCVSRLQKKLPGGEVTSFYDYPWLETDDVFIDGPCSYHTYILGSRTSPNGPKMVGVRVPFVNYLGGTIMHRLIRLTPK